MLGLLKENVKEVLQAQYPHEDVVEIDGQIYHVPNKEKYWKSLRDEVRPGWEVMKEPRGLRHYVIYNPEYYHPEEVCGDQSLVCINLTEDIELPINSSSCFGMFYDKTFPDGFTFSEKFDTSEIVDMFGMFSVSTFAGDINLGAGFKTDKVKDFSYMFYKSCINGNLDLGPNFNLENAINVSVMFNSAEIWKPIKFGDKFNPKSALCLDSMFSRIWMPEGFNIGNNFHVLKSASVENMFYESTLNDDFWLPECFSVDEKHQDCEDLFIGSVLPKRLGDKNLEDIQGIIKGLKERPNKTAMGCLESI